MSDKVNQARNDAGMSDKPVPKYEGKAWFTPLEGVNEPIECTLLLKKLNDAIELFGELGDSYYTDHIFNSSTMMDEWMNDFKPWIDKTYEKLLKFRALMYGDNINWEDLYSRMYEECLAHETYWHKFHEREDHKQTRRIEMLENLLKKNGITKDEMGRDL